MTLLLSSDLDFVASNEVDDKITIFRESFAISYIIYFTIDFRLKTFSGFSEFFIPGIRQKNIYFSEIWSLVFQGKHCYTVHFMLILQNLEKRWFLKNCIDSKRVFLKQTSCNPSEYGTYFKTQTECYSKMFTLPKFIKYQIN